MQDFCSAQVSQIYDRMKFSKLAALVPFLNEHELERVIVDSVKGKDLQVMFNILIYLQFTLLIEIEWVETLSKANIIFSLFKVQVTLLYLFIFIEIIVQHSSTRLFVQYPCRYKTDLHWKLRAEFCVQLTAIFGKSCQVLIETP